MYKEKVALIKELTMLEASCGIRGKKSCQKVFRTFSLVGHTWNKKISNEGTHTRSSKEWAPNIEATAKIRAFMMEIREGFLSNNADTQNVEILGHEFPVCRQNISAAMASLIISI